MAIALLVAGGAGVVATFGYAIAGDSGMAQRAAGAAAGAVVLGTVLLRR